MRLYKYPQWLRHDQGQHFSTECFTYDAHEHFSYLATNGLGMYLVASLKPTFSTCVRDILD